MAVAAASLIALAAMTLAAPVASAKESEGQIKSECAQANGTYHHSGHYSDCCYKDIKGNKFCDYYQDGDYVATGPGRVEQPPSTANPPPPRTNPGTTGAGGLQ